MREETDQKTDVSQPSGMAGLLSLTLTPEVIEEFLTSSRMRSVQDDTQKKYREILERLYEFLPEDKRIHQDTMERWRENLLAEGYAVRSVNFYIAAVNTMLGYYRRYHLRGESLQPASSVQPELTRAEYLRLLKAAKQLENERAYFLIKVFGSMDLPVQELGKLTVESVRDGKVKVVRSGILHLVYLPPCLVEELLGYAQRNGLLSGPIFLNRDGGTMDRTAIAPAIQSVCRTAQVPAKKATPRCLRRLYHHTMGEIQAGMELLAEQTYNRLLDSEQMTAGWDI